MKIWCLPFTKYIILDLLFKLLNFHEASQVVKDKYHMISPVSGT